VEREYFPGREFLKLWVEKQGMEMLAVFRVEGRGVFLM
jgi:hypothetical protein